MVVNSLSLLLLLFCNMAHSRELHCVHCSKDEHHCACEKRELQPYSSIDSDLTSLMTSLSGFYLDESSLSESESGMSSIDSNSTMSFPIPPQRAIWHEPPVNDRQEGDDRRRPEVTQRPLFLEGAGSHGGGKLALFPPPRTLEPPLDLAGSGWATGGADEHTSVLKYAAAAGDRLTVDSSQTVPHQPNTPDYLGALSSAGGDFFVAQENWQSAFGNAIRRRDRANRVSERMRKSHAQNVEHLGASYLDIAESEGFDLSDNNIDASLSETNENFHNLVQQQLGIIQSLFNPLGEEILVVVPPLVTPVHELISGGTGPGVLDHMVYKFFNLARPELARRFKALVQVIMPLLRSYDQNRHRPISINLVNGQQIADGNQVEQFTSTINKYFNALGNTSPAVIVFSLSGSLSPVNGGNIILFTAPDGQTIIINPVIGFLYTHNRQAAIEYLNHYFALLAVNGITHHLDLTVIQENGYMQQLINAAWIFRGASIDVASRLWNDPRATLSALFEKFPWFPE